MTGIIQHEETIKCPSCGTIQKAIVKITIPFYTYIHQCISCNYVIMESEWDALKTNLIKQTNNPTD